MKFYNYRDKFLCPECKHNFEPDLYSRGRTLGERKCPICKKRLAFQIDVNVNFSAWSID